MKLFRLLALLTLLGASPALADAIPPPDLGNLLGGRPVTTTAPTSGQAIVWNGTAWAPGAAGISSTLTSAHVLVGNGSNVATDVAVSGDLTLANTGAFTVGSIGGKAVSLANSLTTSGNFALTLTTTAATNSTLPSGTHSLAPLDSPSFTTPALGVATATSLAIGAGSAITSSGAGGALGTNAFTSTAYLPLTGGTVTGALTVSGASFGLAGNFSAPAWTTAGIRYANAAATLTDTTSSGTVAAAYTDLFGGNTIAASAATTFTNYYTTYIKNPVAGTNVTMTNKWALGVDNLNAVGTILSGTGFIYGTSLTNYGFSIGYAASVSLTLASGKILGWSNNANIDMGAQDTGFSRVSAGLIGVGTGAAASIAGSLSMAGLTASGAAVKFTGLGTDAAATDTTACILSDGTLTKGSGTLGICLGTSSMRFKNDVVPARDGLDQLLALRPKNFFYKPGYGDDGAREQYGFLAEDVIHVLPKLVGLDRDGLPNSVDMVGMIPVIARSMQQFEERLSRVETRR